MAADPDHHVNQAIEAIGGINMSRMSSSDDEITPEDLIKRLEWAAEEEDVKAVQIEAHGK